MFLLLQILPGDIMGGVSGRQQAISVKLCRDSSFF